MRIYQVDVKNFRGIKKASFKFDGPLVCLIGPGDTTKSTILDAIEYALSPNWFIPIDDSDFTDCDSSNNIEITTTVGPIPEELMSASKYGLHLRGWNIARKELHDEPKPNEGDIYVLSIHLVIDNLLTPEWLVVTQRNPEGAHISYKDRQKFGVSRIGNNIDNELAWVRGSSLLRLSKDKHETEKLLIQAYRQLKGLIPPESFISLKEGVERAKTSGNVYGINTNDFNPNVDPRVLKGSSSTISLHDGKIPFRRMGLGTCRLMAIGLQLECIKLGGILLIDEIEQALEPHRLKHLLRTLTKNMNTDVYGQIFITTHSPATLEELGADPIYCVHYNKQNKEPELEKLRHDAQGTVRRTPEAFLSPKVIICEGTTEIGLLRAFEKKIIERNNDTFSFAYNKVTIVDGEGTSASQRAFDLATHKYKTCLFADSDRRQEWKWSEINLIEVGVEIVCWQDNYNTEMQLFNDIPKEKIVNILNIAMEENGIEAQSILQSINSGLATPLVEINQIPQYGDLPNLRQKIAQLASKKEWFKTVSAGEKLGEFLFGEIFESVKTTEFYKRFESMLNWAKNER